MSSRNINRGRGLKAAGASDDQGPCASETVDFNEIYRTEAPRLVRYFRARLRSNDDPGDLVQESFARLVASMAKQSLPSPAAYLQRIARNLLYDRTKRLETRFVTQHLPIDDECEVSVPPDQMHRLEANDVMRVYRQALAELPERTREVYLLHRVDELTYKEIGARVGISIPTVQYHVARALSYIDAALEQE